MALIIVIAIVLVIAVFIIHANKGKKGQKKKGYTPAPRMEDRTMMDIAKKVGQSGHGNYWHSFKARKPKEAKAIQELCDCDMDAISDADAFQIVTSLLRWSKNAEIPIASLKSNFIAQMKSLLSEGATFDGLLSRLKIEKSKEAIQFNISEDFTICNFMYEWLIEMKNESDKDSMTEKIASKLSIPKDQIDSFKEEIKKKEEDLNMAPDISQLDREENRLFALANEGVKQLTEITSLTEDKKYRLDENGKFEARILCSVMVIKLHSHFKNEIDLDIQADRYFLLLADSVTGDYPDDEINFINSRIAFYNDSIHSVKEDPYSKTTELLLGKIFYLLYLNPLSTTFENHVQNGTISSDAIMTLRMELEDIIKDMEIRRLLITSKYARDMKLRFLFALNNLIPETKKGMLNQDVAWLFADQLIKMIKSGNIDRQMTSVLPPMVIRQIKELGTIYNDGGELNKEQMDNVFDNAKDEYIRTFQK